MTRSSRCAAPNAAEKERFWRKLIARLQEASAADVRGKKIQKIRDRVVRRVKVLQLRERKEVRNGTRQRGEKRQVSGERKRFRKIHRPVLMGTEDYTNCLEKASGLLRSAVAGVQGSFLRELL